MEIDEFLSNLTLQEYLELKEKINDRLEAYLSLIYKDISKELQKIIDSLNQKGLELVVEIDDNVIPVRHAYNFDVRAKGN